jgi:hypothetical protein
MLIYHYQGDIIIKSTKFDILEERKRYIKNKTTKSMGFLFPRKKQKNVQSQEHQRWQYHVGAAAAALMSMSLLLARAFPFSPRAAK